jgi:CheY-like chemotaxis protein
VLHSQLQEWNFSPLVASSPQEALQMIVRHQPFDLVITDMEMPDMDGVGLARTIQSRDSNLPIILLSATSALQRQNNDDLFSHILTKPVRQKAFFNAVTSVLRKREQTPVPANAPRKLFVEFAQKYPLRILIAEDNPVNQILAVRTLRKLGYDPSVADNGLLALESLQGTNFDVVFMDVQMPEMDGLETTRQIRKNGDEQLIIIAMTANALSGDKEVCLEAGMNDYISKPIKLDELIMILERWSLHIQSKVVS